MIFFQYLLKSYVEMEAFQDKEKIINIPRRPASSFRLKLQHEHKWQVDWRDAAQFGRRYSTAYVDITIGRTKIECIDGVALPEVFTSIVDAQLVIAESYPLHFPNWFTLPTNTIRVL